MVKLTLGEWISAIISVALCLAIGAFLFDWVINDIKEANDYCERTYGEYVWVEITGSPLATMHPGCPTIGQCWICMAAKPENSKNNVSVVKQ